MRDNEPLYAVTWIDSFCGHLALKCPDAKTALERRDSIERDGGQKVRDVRAWFQLNATSPVIPLQPCD